jgi:PAS domain S-box-containing protein
VSTSPGTTLILNVDDNDGARYAKSRVLRLAGFDIAEASTGGDALAKVRELQPSLVLLDTRLPDLNGFDVCRQIKADPATARILVLQTSASFLGKADKIRALDGGADNYLVEPIEPEELIANVNALLRLGRAESQLRESEMRFRQIAENIEVVFWMFAPQERRILYVSRAYEVLWQAEIGGLYGDFMAWMLSVHAEDAAAVTQAFEGLLGWTPYDLDYRLTMPDGTIRWVRDQGFVINDDRGYPYRVARVTHDITKRKQAERALTELDRTKDEFLATLAHELRNPLGPILNASSLMQARGLATTREAMDRSLNVITRQTKHLARLVDDLLDVSRITTGKVAIRQDNVAARAFIEAAVESVDPFLKSRRHHLKIKLAEEDLRVLGDSVRLTQIVGNLLHNAGKYTAENGVIELTLSRSEASLHIEIRDNGIGIDESKITLIFDLFTQADTAPDRAQDGLGIGLSLVKKLTALHGGTVTAASAGRGTGSTFLVTLPLAQVDEPLLLTPSSSPVVPVLKNVRRVLVVDDNKDSADTLVALLDAMGFVTAVAYSSTDALISAPVFMPEIVILDIGLPQLSGYDVAKLMRKEPYSKNLLLIALTGYGQEKDKQEAFMSGFDCHLTKPVVIEELVLICSQMARSDAT